MALFDADMELNHVRPFRDGDGKVTGIFVSARATPPETDSSADEPSFSGQSYLNLEMFLDNAREADTLRIGERIHVVIDVPQTGGEQWASHSTP